MNQNNDQEHDAARSGGLRVTAMMVVAVCAWFVGHSEVVSAANAADRPNVVLIFIDDMGYGDIGPFGATKQRTPNLDTLASQGMKFHSFYATPVCSMSRAALLTGCYNARVSIPGVLFPGSTIGLHQDETTVAEVLKSQGYATICIGKWHLGHREPFLPMHQGFDSYFGIPYSNDMTIDPQHAQFAKDCVFREGVTAESARKEALRHKVPLMRGAEVVEYPTDQDLLTKRYTEEAVKFIKEHQQEPFFVYLPHSMVHVPLAATSDFRGKSANGLIGDAIEEIDWSVGQIMKTLDDLKLADNTLVIFTSDNGAASGSSLPFRGKKGSNYEGGVREPCIMRWPGKIPAGSECREIAGNIDVLPTLAKIAGAPVSADNTLNGRQLDGRDITSLMFQKKAEPPRDVHLYYHGEQLQAIRQGDWKLIYAGAAQNAKNAKQPGKQAAGGKKNKKPVEPLGPELFNLADDPTESKNLADAKPELVKELRALAEKLGDEIKEHKRPAGKI